MRGQTDQSSLQEWLHYTAKESDMKIDWKRAGLIAALVALVGVVGVGAVAYAEASDEATGWPDFRARMHEAVAGVLGISVDEYDAAVDTAHEQVIDEAVAEGWLTEEQAELMQERMAEGPGFGGRGKGFAPFGGRGGFEGLPGPGGRMGPWGDNPVGVAAEVLGLSQEDLLAELRDGKSIADIAEEHGVEPQAIADAYVAKVTESLEQAVADEKITQEQADAILTNIEERAADMLENAGGAHLFGGFGRGGMRGGFDRFGRGGLPGRFGTETTEGAL
jgi:hypothetical protein